MFTEIINTKYQPKQPIMIWDGDCSFCKYWIIKWKSLTDDSIRYVPYQEIAYHITDIPESDFKEAVRLIEPSGRVFNGPDAAFRALSYSNKYGKWHKLYKQSDLFKYLCDKGYVLIANNRNFMFKLTKLIWGKNPVKSKSLIGFK